MARRSSAEIVAEKFHAFIISRRNVKRPGTVSGYIQSMKLFIRFLEDEKKVTEKTLSFENFNFSIVSEWRDWLLETRKNNPNTINLRLSQITAFMDWLHENNPTYTHTYNSVKHVEKMRKVEIDPLEEVLPEKGVSALIAAASRNNDTDIKYNTLMSMQYTTGGRSDEILSIRVGELHLDDKRACVTVIGKGRKSRTLYIPKPTVRKLVKYISLFHGTSPDPEAYLFYSPSKGAYTKLTNSAYNKMIRKYAGIANGKDSSCPTRVHPHQLRHCWATHSLDHDVSIYTISKGLGHQNVETTMRYLGITQRLMNNAMSTTESLAAKNTKTNWRYSEKLEDLFK